MTDSSDDKGILLFGRDISKIPCFRNSFLYGISGGIGIGLMYFMFTSRPQAATHCGMASFTVVTLAYWIQCRYNYSKTKFEMQRLQELIRNHALYEGTELEKEMDTKFSGTPVDV